MQKVLRIICICVLIIIIILTVFILVNPRSTSGNSYIPANYSFEYEPQNYVYELPADFSGSYANTLSEPVNSEPEYSEHAYSAFAEVTVPILMYHHLAEIADNPWTVTPDNFERQMQWLTGTGFNTVSLRQLYNFVHFGADLPENPVVITFDDGYLSVYEYAFPILYRYGLNASIFVIGSQVGTSYYKDTGHPTTPKFCLRQARTMTDSGLIEIQSHTYDMHQWAPFEIGPARENILIMYGENYDDYIAFLTYDHLRISYLVENATGQSVFALAFPLGIYDELSLDVLRSLGVSVTLTVRHGLNIISESSPDSLHLLNRKNVSDALSEYEFLNLLRPSA